MLTKEMRKKIISVANEFTEVRELQFIRDHPDDVEIVDISDVWMNDVARVSLSGDTSNAVVFKYAPPTIKFLGPNVPVTQYRALAEFNSYTYFERVCPGSVPRPYCYSAQHNTLAVQYLDGYVEFSDQLMRGVIDLAVVEQIAMTLGRIHVATHRATLPPGEFQKLLQKFPRTQVNDMIGDKRFSEWLDRDNPANRVDGELLDYVAVNVYDNEEFLANVAELKDVYSNKKECLVHYDLHAGSVLVQGSVIKLIDNEFSTVGAASFEMALLLTHFICHKERHLTMFTDDVTTHRNIADDMRQAFVRMIEVYVETMSPCFADGSDVSVNRGRFVSEMAGFLGSCMCARVIGRFVAREVEKSNAAKVKVVRQGVDLLRRYREIRSVQQLIDCVWLADKRTPTKSA